MKRPATVPIAILAALVWAPSAVLAAPPNRLSDPWVAPTTATATTPVSVAVRYTSSGGNAALAVSASIGPLDLPLVRTDGTTTDGTWSGTSLVPVGSWTVVFRAAVDRGPAPSLEGPTLTVMPPATPAPASSSPVPAASGPDSSKSPYVEGAGRSAPPSTAPVPAPAASGGSNAVATTPPAAQPAARATPSGNPGPTLSAGRSARPGRGSGSAPAAVVRSATPRPSSDAGLLEGADNDPGAGLVAMLAVLLGVAAAALLGTGWLVTVRDRADDEDLPSAARAVARARGSAALRLSDEDPVIAALGLQASDEPRADAPRRGPGPPG